MNQNERKVSGSLVEILSSLTHSKKQLERVNRIRQIFWIKKSLMKFLDSGLSIWKSLSQKEFRKSGMGKSHIMILWFLFIRYLTQEFMTCCRIWTMI